jgi:uncharacterized protein GlcG (DUF336 family)
VVTENKEIEKMIEQSRLFSGWFFALLAFTLCAIAPARLSAQNTNQAVISAEAAKKSLSKVEISGEAAEKIAHLCEDFATKHNYPTVVFILDPSGNIVHAHRMDGIRPVQFDGALRKAKTALFYRASTHELQNRAQKSMSDQLRFMQRDLYPYAGGLPIIQDGQLIGAIGVAGSDPTDEQCAYDALTAVVGPQPPLVKSNPAEGQAPR